jgi:alkylation response protein AidB-like acyl-CoA dehydrogenase
MDYTMTKEQELYQQEIIDFSHNVLNQKGTLETFIPEMWEQVSSLGLHGIAVSEEYGGLGENYTTAARVFEGLGYGCMNNGLIFAINNHIWVALNLIYLYGTPLLKEKYLSSMIKGKKIGAIAITETEAGTDALNMSTSAIEEEECYILNGSKAFISNAPIADIFIVFAVTQFEPVKRITAFIVEKSMVGVSVGQEIEKMGLGGCPTAELVFKDCKVPKENVLGTRNAGNRILLSALEWERCFEFVPNIGTMQRIMERCIEHANTRKQFGKPLGENQSIAHKIAEMKIGIELSKNMLYKITAQMDDGKSAYLDTSIFKYYVSSRYITTCRDAIQIFGGYGYTKEYDYERELRDAIASSIYSGTNEMQLNTIYSLIY